MTIKKVIVANREDAPMLYNQHSNVGNTYWLTISNIHAKPLVPASTKRIKVAKFDDIAFPFRNNNSDVPRKLKTWICNLHFNKNNETDIVLIINCHAGISRSAAFGKFCEINLEIPEVEFRNETIYKSRIHPSRYILEELKVKSFDTSFIVESTGQRLKLKYSNGNVAVDNDDTDNNNNKLTREKRNDKS